MKLLFITGINAFGGQEVFLAQLARGLSDKGVEVDVACPPNPRLLELLKELQLTHYTYPFSSQFDIGTVNNIARLITSNHYTIVHTHGTRGGYLGRLAARKAGTTAKIIHQMYVPTHVVPSGDEGKRGFWIHTRGDIYVLVERFFGKSTHKILAVSNHLRDYTISRIGIPEAKIEVLYNTSLRTSNFPDRSSVAQINTTLLEKPLSLLFAGRLAYQKGLPYLIDSLAHTMQDASQADATLTICGDGKLEQKLKHQVEHAKLSSNVSFQGWQQDLTPYFNSCNVLILSSLWEGLPLVILEAMSHGKAIIATRVGGIPEAVIPGKTGLLVDPEDARGLANAILECYHNRRKVVEMGLAGYDLCLKKFTLEASVQKALDIYQQVLA